MAKHGFAGGFQDILIAGNNNADRFPLGVDSPISYELREAVMAFEPFVGWLSDEFTEKALQFGQKYENEMRPFAAGIYANGENADCDGCQWNQIVCIPIQW